MIGSESKDALDRENCVVIQGLPESTAHTSKERISADLAMFQHLLNDILHSGETITVRAAFRLGKKDIEQSQNVKPRPIKIVLDNKEEAKLLLSRKTNLRNSHKQIFFQPDYSPAERLKRRELVIEMKRRLAAGESNLVIYRERVIQRNATLLWNQPMLMMASAN
ncbi:unnamed protein product [Schistocephalus solidus]|uniref:Uncharacterized protein n=1 Tax=Schistocephalus solidus TaxID=70667 RepID=A0A183T4P6_SCHSO|nr:unnamed protein product [Schistocephalus solidus]